MKIKNEITPRKLIIISSIFLVFFGNIAFFKNILVIYPANLENILFLLSLVILFVCVNIFLFSLICFKQTIKPVLITVLLMSSLAAYFMDSYNVIIDDVMIDNIIKTDINESLDLLSFKQLLYFILLGVLPSVLVYKAKITSLATKKAIISHLILLAGSLLLAVIIILSLSNFYASFFREHKSLRFYANPSYYLYSSIKYVNHFFKNNNSVLSTIGLDAFIPPSDEHRELIIFVVGETARADHFSLNGYSKKTNPYLEKQDVISFDNVSACGTSTAHSVPCMFSIYNRTSFSKGKAQSTENALDILQRAGVNVIWLDNNSDSKGVADRIPYQNFKLAENNPICDSECRDEGMLTNLQTYIDDHPKGDIFIVLHQMGNHGPAYYKRYPKRFEKFTPTCQTNQLEQCSEEEISNTYDNALVYTDYFLSKTIQLLKNNNKNFESALFYVSDHGESLGENNLYLHGLPYLIAPDAQTHVPMVMWFSDSFDAQDINLAKLKTQIHKKLSHDNLFHTILGLMEIKSSVYNESLDIIEHEEYE
ncbi:MAG: phosphoethanolamine--lipid A transferase [Pseudomonadota bacterium]